MATVGMIVMMICVLVSVLYLAFDVRKRKELHLRIKELEGQLAALTGGKKAEEEAPVQTESQESLIQGLVTKTVFKRGNRSGSNYQVTDKMPQFNTVRETAQFGMGLFTAVDDPTVVNLAGYGSLSKTDSYIALRLVAQSLLKQITELDEEKTEDQSGADAT